MYLLGRGFAKRGGTADETEVRSRPAVFQRPHGISTMRIFCHAAMTFHLRSLLPVVEGLLAQGHSVFMARQGRFDVDGIRARPRAVSVRDPGALRFVARGIGLSDHCLDRIHWLPRLIPRRFIERGLPGFDLYLSTTKGFPWLAACAPKDKPQVAVGYQNILDTFSFRGQANLPKDCPGTIAFADELRQAYPKNRFAAGLPFMDYLYHRHRATRRTDDTFHALLLHPGGWRNVVTLPSDGQETCLRKQEALYRRVIRCLPPGARLTLKIHPLAARYHDAEANRPIAEALGIDIAEGWLGDILFQCDAALSAGSSSLFEVLPFGIPHWVLGFLGGERVEFYKEFNAVYLDSEDALRRVLAERRQPEWTAPEEVAFVENLTAVSDGKATQRVLDVIARAMG